MLKKYGLLFPLVWMLAFSSYGQLQKGDWLATAELNYQNFYNQSNTVDTFFTANSIDFQLGKFLLNKVAVGVKYGHTFRDQNQESAINAPIFFYENIHQLSVFGRYYFGRKPTKRQLFLHAEASWTTRKQEFINITGITEINSQGREILFGMGLSIFQFPNAGVELFLAYPLLNINTTSFSEQLNFGNGTIVLESRFQIYFGGQKEGVFPAGRGALLAKGRRFVYGNFAYSPIAPGLFDNSFLTLNFELQWGHFVSDRTAVGVELPMDIIYSDRRIALDYEINFFGRYYHSITNYLQLFGHLGMGIGFDATAFIRLNRPDPWMITADLIPVVGGGLNLFLNENVSYFWCYKYVISKDWSAIDATVWNAKTSTVQLETGLAFFF